MINDHDTMEVSGGKLVFLGLTQDGVDQYQIGHVVVLKSDVSPLLCEGWFPFCLDMVIDLPIQCKYSDYW